MEAPRHSFASTDTTCDRLTQHNQTTSPLLRLPAEIRNHVYSLIFWDHVVNVYPRYFQNNMKPSSPRHPDYTGVLAIVFTCRQLSIEAKDVFIRTCIFDVSLNRSRDEMRKTMGASHCDVLESIKIDDIGICNLKDFDWTVDNDKGGCFGALRCVNTEWNLDDAKEEKRLKKKLRALFGRPALELVHDSRLFGEQWAVSEQ